MLLKALYGTRDAAVNWMWAYANFMEELGFRKGAICPCIFWLEARDLVVFVHGDDFLVLGEEDELDWFRTRIEERFETKFRGRMGPDANNVHELRVLNRIVRWDEAGIEYEADQRHAEIIMEQTGTNTGISVVTPGVKQGQDGDELELDRKDQAIQRNSRKRKLLGA